MLRLHCITRPKNKCCAPSKKYSLRPNRKAKKFSRPKCHSIPSTPSSHRSSAPRTPEPHSYLRERSLWAEFRSASDLPCSVAFSHRRMLPAPSESRRYHFRESPSIACGKIRRPRSLVSHCISSRVEAVHCAADVQKTLLTFVALHIDVVAESQLLNSPWPRYRHDAKRHNLGLHLRTWGLLRS